MPRYWIDTDPGLDDALAIVLAIREVGTDLAGLSTVQGNVDEELGAQNLSRVLATCAARGLTPDGWAPTLVRGSRLALAADRYHRAHHVHGDDGLGNLPWASAPPWDRYAPTFGPQAIVDAARAGPDLHLVCIGPLTNLALALRIEPELPARLAGLTIMGGSLRAGGNETLTAEFNFAADAEAARSVLEAGFRDVLLVPMDGALTAQLRADDLDRVLRIGTPAAATAGEVLDVWAERIRAQGAPLYDPTAWLATTHPDLVPWESVYVTVDVGRDVAHGASLADWRRRSGREPNVRAALSVRRDALIDTLCEALT
jgi:purine nucleosidase